MRKLYDIAFTKIRSNRKNLESAHKGTEYVYLVLKKINYSMTFDYYCQH